MNLFTKLLGKLRAKKYEEFRRWSTEELDEKKKYLESKNPEDFTAEDHYLSAEWTIQRYLPAGEEPSPEKWTGYITDIRRQIDGNIQQAKVGDVFRADPPGVGRYVISKEDFEKDIVPCLSKYGVLPEPYATDRQGKEFWLSLFEFTQEYSYRHGEAKDALLGSCDVVLAEMLVKELARTYSALRQSAIMKYPKVKLICTGKQCQQCTLQYGIKFEVDELLESFRKGSPKFPHPLEEARYPNWCHAPVLVPEIPIVEGEDEDFRNFMVKVFDE